VNLGEFGDTIRNSSCQLILAEADPLERPQARHARGHQTYIVPESCNIVPTNGSAPRSWHEELRMVSPNPTSRRATLVLEWSPREARGPRSHRRIARASWHRPL
jgi:hypothetical protein